MVICPVIRPTYAGCNFRVKRQLRPMALHPAQAQCIIPDMSQKSASSGRFAHRHFFREWRRYRNLTQSQLIARLQDWQAEGVPLTEASLSRLENGKQPYTQQTLEALAAVLDTEPASLLMRDPSHPEAIWSIWERASSGERDQIVRVADALVNFRHEAQDRTSTDN